MSITAIKFLVLLEEKKYQEAVQLFKNISQEEQEALMKSVGETISGKRNSAIDSPNVVVILNRTLKEGKTFEDFYEAWKPPVEGIQCGKNKNFYNYFSGPVRVINVQNAQDPREILSIGMMWGEQHQLDNCFAEEIKFREKTEQLRAEKIEKVADKVGENKFCFVLSDDMLGK